MVFQGYESLNVVYVTWHMFHRLPSAMAEFPHIVYSTSSSLRDLVLGLLQCHSIISREAAAMFYRTNTFSFRGYHSWRPINLWLKSIGMSNKKYLTNLEIWMPPPMHVEQESDGKCRNSRELFLHSFRRGSPASPSSAPLNTGTDRRYSGEYKSSGRGFLQSFGLRWSWFESRVLHWGYFPRVSAIKMGGRPASRERLVWHGLAEFD